jgi:phosphatidylglycerophosphatase A
VKIGPVGWLDRNIHGALGVMLDDIAAGLMAAIAVLGLLLWMT